MRPIGGKGKFPWFALAMWLLALVFVSCSRQESHTEEIMKSDSEHAEASFWDASSIKIMDVPQDRYRKPLDIDLSKEEVKAFHLAAEKQADIKEDPGKAVQRAMAGNYYCIRLFKEDGKEKAVLTVDLAHTVWDESGNIVPSKPYIAQWLSNVESTHGLTYSYVLNRAPGTGYFNSLTDTDYAVMEKIQGGGQTVRREYSQPQASVIAESLAAILQDGSTLSNTQYSPDVKWKLSLYKEGNILYEFEGDTDAIYENGFRLNNMEAMELFESILQ